MSKRRNSWRMRLGVLLLWTSRVTCFIAMQTRIRPIKTVLWKRYFPKPVISCSVHTVVRGESESQVNDDNDQKLVIATAALLSSAEDISNTRRGKRSRDDRLKPVQSLIEFLSRTRLEQVLEPSNVDFLEAFDSAIISGVRTAGSSGEFRLIYRVVEACLQFASLHGSILPPRLFGEAIENLSSRTKANAGKIRRMWQLGVSSKDLLREPLGAFELNTLVKGLASRGKVRSSLDVVRESDIVPDSYTASVMLGILSDSIVKGQVPVEKASRLESPCWQWNEAMLLLDSFFSPELLNNFVYAAALKLNEKASTVFSSPGRRHYGAMTAMKLLERMKRNNVSPDVVTCSLILSAFDKGYQWAAALTLLNAMTNHQKNSQDDASVWSLPAPNVFSYATVISACARCNKCDEALEILNRMRRDNHSVKPNTWVYNSALSSCVQPSNLRRGKNQRQHQPLRTALSLLELMDKDADEGLDTTPDTVTYNTVLAILDGRGIMFHDDVGEVVCEYIHSDTTKAFSSQEDVVGELLEQMKRRGVSRDSITYCNAIKGVHSNGDSVLRVLQGALDDNVKTVPPQSKLKGRAVQGSIFVFNTALSVLARRGDMSSLSKVFLLMETTGVKANSESLTHLITALGKAGRAQAIVRLVESQRNSMLPSWAEIGMEELDCAFLGSFPLLTEETFTASIGACLEENDIEGALGVVASMKTGGYSPSNESMQGISYAYCRLAMESAADETRREVNMSKKRKKEGTRRMLKSNNSESRIRAIAAFEIAKSLDEPPATLLAAVSRALGAAGLWDQSRDVLRSLHKAAIKDLKVESNIGANVDKGARDVLSGLHRSLLKLSARRGNVTAALSLVDDTQTISKWFPPTLDSSSVGVANCTAATSTLQSYLLSADAAFNVSQEEAYVSIMNSMNFSTTLRLSNRDVGMKAEDWKLLMIAASKSGHWKVCMGTLQFLRSFVEATNHNLVPESNREVLDKSYGKLSRSFTSAILCFEMRHQYAWAVRSIDDWIAWSGRRPPIDGILAAFRILAARGRGNEVRRVLSRIMQAPTRPPSINSSQGNSDQALYIGAISTLHRSGLYDDADDVFMEGISQGYIPFEVTRGEMERQNQLILDLHGMNTPLAHSAVRIALQREVEIASYTQGTEKNVAVDDMIIVTGLGRKSWHRFRPVLRPEVQRMLQEEFYPPLSTSSIPGNMGALRVPAEDIKAWLAHRRQQKGVRMLAVADVIKNLSSGDRLRKMIASKLGSDDDA